MNLVRAGHGEERSDEAILRFIGDCFDRRRFASAVSQ